MCNRWDTFIIIYNILNRLQLCVDKQTKLPWLSENIIEHSTGGPPLMEFSFHKDFSEKFITYIHAIYIC